MNRRVMLGLTLPMFTGVPLERALAGPAPLPPVPLEVRIARRWEGDDLPGEVVEASFVDRQIAAANALFEPHGVTFREVTEARAAIDGRYARLETRADRDALAALLGRRVITVFVVERLRDVDAPEGYRLGVTWRKLSDLRKKYIIVVGDAWATTLAHELGHYLGNGHSRVKNNLMSYDREDGEITLDAVQGQTARRAARDLFATGALAAR